MKKLFLITPYTDPYFTRKQRIITEVCLDHDYEMLAGKIPDKNVELTISETLSILRDTDCLIADLTFERPSCYYELGFIQALEKKSLIIASQGTQIHFIQNRDQVSFYTSMEEYQELIVSFFSSLS